MYDRRLRIGRFGYEIAHKVVVHPRHIKWTPDAGKLSGGGLDLRGLQSTSALPPGWHWMGDPTDLVGYLPAGVQPDAKQLEWLLTDHHDRFGHTLGYRSSPLFASESHIIFQLEAVSQPIEHYPLQRFARDMSALRRSVRELIGLGVVGVFPGQEGKQQGILEQVNLELYDSSVPGAGCPARKLMEVGLGLYLLATFADELRPPQPYWGPLFDYWSAKREHRATLYDLFTNVRRLMDGWFVGPHTPLRPTWPWFKRILTSPAHLAVLAQNINPNKSRHYVHGYLTLTGPQLARISPRDLELFRQVGIDPLFLDLFAREPQPHLHSMPEEYLFEYLDRTLPDFIPMDDIVPVIRRTVLESRPDPEVSIELPLFHPRKAPAHGFIYVEMRDIENIKLAGSDRYPYRYRNLDGVQLVDYGHLRVLALDLRHLFEIATLAGADLYAAALRDERFLRDRDLGGLRQRYVPMFDYLFRVYQRPRWADPG